MPFDLEFLSWFETPVANICDVAFSVRNHFSDWVLRTANYEMYPFQERRGRRDHDGASQHDKDEGRVLIPEDKGIIHSVVHFVSPVVQ